VVVVGLDDMPVRILRADSDDRPGQMVDTVDV
jgi:hypothetical protein